MNCTISNPKYKKQETTDRYSVNECVKYVIDQVIKQYQFDYIIYGSKKSRELIKEHDQSIETTYSFYMVFDLLRMLFAKRNTMYANQFEEANEVIKRHLSSSLSVQPCEFHKQTEASLLCFNCVIDLLLIQLNYINTIPYDPNTFTEKC